jgi:hypothetical protein
MTKPTCLKMTFFKIFENNHRVAEENVKIIVTHIDEILSEKIIVLMANSVTIISGIIGFSESLVALISSIN